jgi:hypothetical protein
MVRLSLLLAAGVMAISATSAQASVVFSDSLQTTLAPSNWASYNSAAIVPVGSLGNALHFNAGGSGGDLFSVPFAGPGTYTIKVDYLCGTPGGCGGYIGLAPGASTVVTPTSPTGGDAWLATDTPAAYGAPFPLIGNGTAFTTNTFTFTVTSPGTFGLKLEDFTGAGGTAGDAYFRNLSVSAVPEPATWGLMLMGFGMIGFASRRRAKVSTNVTYA